MRRGQDVAISDIAGTLLMVGAVVLAGGAITAIVASNLSETGAPVTSFALAAPRAGDASLRLAYRAGEPLALDDLSITLARGDASPATVARASWTVSDATTLRPGQTIALPLAPSAAAGDTLRVTVASVSANTLLAELSTAIPAGGSGLVDATLVASLTPPTLVADGTSASRLAVRVSHPAGALAIASVTADLSSLAAASGSTFAPVALNDRGVDGDEAGGDGIWSTLVRVPASTAAATYTIPVRATDIEGGSAGTIDVALAVSAFFVGGGAVEGQTASAPTSVNVTQFVVRNWTYDRANPTALDGDVLALRVISGTWSWSVEAAFEYRQGIAGITSVRMWNANASTLYVPATGQRVSIAALDLNLNDPTASGFACSSGCVAPMTYRNANIEGTPGVIIAHLRDSAKIDPDETGIYAVDVVLR